MCSLTRAPHTANAVLKSNRVKTCASFDALLRQEKEYGECEDGVWSWWLYLLVSLFYEIMLERLRIESEQIRHWCGHNDWGDLSFYTKQRNIKPQQDFSQSTTNRSFFSSMIWAIKTKLWTMDISTHLFNGLSPTTCTNNKVKVGTLYSESKPHEEWKSCSLIIHKCWVQHVISLPLWRGWHELITASVFPMC